MSIRASDDGFAVPVVLFMLLSMMAILAVGAVAAMDTQRGTIRDTNTKSALAVAESGVDTALLRYARAEPTETEPCVDGSGTTYSLGGAQWCAPESGQVDGDAFTYYIRPEGTSGEDGYEYELEIVAIGDVDGVNRVVNLTSSPVFAVDPEPVYLTESLVADEHMHLAPGTRINGDIGSNGTIDLQNSTEVCGDIRYGSTLYSSPSDMENSQCDSSYEVIEKTFELERIDLPEGEDWAANNSHFETLGAGVAWDPDAKTLATTGNNIDFTITEPGPFLLCRLDVTGQSIMRIAPGVEAQFYFDDPANCNLDKEPMDAVESTSEDGYLQMLFDRGNLTVDEGEPFPIMYFLGSDTDETIIDINTNSGAGGEFKGVIYGPDTHIVNTRSGFRFTGAMVGKTIWIDPGAETEADVEIIGGEFQIGVNEAIYTVFMKEGFRECPVSAADSETPWEGC